MKTAPNNPKKMFPLLRINDAVVSELEKMAGGELRLLDNILRDAAVRLLEGKLIEINQAVLQALEADGKVLKCNVKKILR
jgi:DNA transposition AAA+ family ATPase